MQGEMENINLKIFDLSANNEMKADREDVVPVPFIKEDLESLKKEVNKISFEMKNSFKGVEVRIKKLNVDSQFRKVYQNLNTKAATEDTLNLFTTCE